MAKTDLPVSYRSRRQALQQNNNNNDNDDLQDLQDQQSLEITLKCVLDVTVPVLHCQID